MRIGLYPCEQFPWFRLQNAIGEKLDAVGVNFEIRWRLAAIPAARWGFLGWNACCGEAPRSRGFSHLNTIWSS